MSYVCILLSAGRSSRMGQLKALMRWQKKTLIKYQLEQLHRSCVDDVIVVLGYKADEIKKTIQNENATIVCNEQYTEGKSTSIRVGLTEAGNQYDGLLISAVDQPVPFTVINTLIHHKQKKRSLITVPVYKEKRGHPVLFSNELYHELIQVQEKTKGLRKVMKDYQDQIAYVDVNERAVTWNLNTKQDYDSIVRYDGRELDRS